MSENSNSRDSIPRNLRREILVEAGHKCAIPQCGQGNVDVHHIIPWAKVKEHSRDNLIALCPNCHRKAHLGEIDRKSLRYYKINLARALSHFSQIELDLMLELYRELKYISVSWPANMIYQIRKAWEEGFIVIRSNKGSRSKENLGTSPNLYVQISDKGRRYIENMGYRKIALEKTTNHYSEKVTINIEVNEVSEEHNRAYITTKINSLVVSGDQKYPTEYRSVINWFGMTPALDGHRSNKLTYLKIDGQEKISHIEFEDEIHEPYSTILNPDEKILIESEVGYWLKCGSEPIRWASARFAIITEINITNINPDKMPVKLKYIAMGEKKYKDTDICLGQEMCLGVFHNTKKGDWLIKFYLNI